MRGTIQALVILPLIATTAYAGDKDGSSKETVDSTSSTSEKVEESKVESIDVYADGWFSSIDPATGVEKELGWWDFHFDTRQDLNSGVLWYVTGRYDNGPNDDEEGDITGYVAYDGVNDDWVLDLHLVCTADNELCRNGYESDLVLRNTSDIYTYEGYWTDNFTAPGSASADGDGNYGHGQLFFRKEVIQP